jgi:ABC-type antimicrobial peptide transport system permease subunit
MQHATQQNARELLDTPDLPETSSDYFATTYLPWSAKARICSAITKLETNDHLIFSRPYRVSYGRFAYLVGVLAALVVPYGLAFSVLILLLTGTMMYLIVHHRLPQYFLLISQGFSAGSIRQMVAVQAVVMSLAAALLGLAVTLILGTWINTQVAGSMSSDCGASLDRDFSLLPVAVLTGDLRMIAAWLLTTALMVAFAWTFIFTSGVRSLSAAGNRF